jgi:hypothetical protein
MRLTSFAMTFAVVLACAAPGVQDKPRDPQDPLPPGHPPTSRPALPPGHPPATTPALPPGHPPTTVAAAPADPADVGDVAAVVRAYYAAISGAPGAARDWDRFRSLFMAGARMMTVHPGPNGDAPLVITPEQFVSMNDRYFEVGGYVETEVRAARSEFGQIAHVWSTYEARRGGPDARPYSRGINSFQLALANGRWWITQVSWDRERAGTKVPDEYLPHAAP